MSSSLDEYLSFNTTITNTNKILEEEMKADYDLYVKQPAEYRKKVDAVPDLFHLTTPRGNRLKSSDCPVYIVGHSNEYVMVGLNPGYSAVNNPVEEIEARKSWEYYLNCYQYKFFKFFEANKFESPYYKSLYLLLSSLSNYKEVNLWQFFDSHTINLELIPYHSEGIIFPNLCSKEQINYLQNRLQINLDYIKRKLTKPKIKLVICNEKTFHVLLIGQKLIR